MTTLRSRYLPGSSPAANAKSTAGSTTKTAIINKNPKMNFISD